MIFMLKKKWILSFVVLLCAYTNLSLCSENQAVSSLVTKLKNKNLASRMRRFLKLHGREIVALTAGAAVGGLGGAFATHYFDNKRMNKSNTDHAVVMQEIQEKHSAELARLAQEHENRLEEISRDHEKTIEQKNQEQSQAAIAYEEKLAAADKERADEMERMRQTFIADRAEEQELFQEKIAELEQSFEAQSKAQAQQLAAYAAAQQQQFAQYHDEQLAQISQIKGSIEGSSTQIMDKIGESAREQKALISQNHEELLSAIAESKEALKDQFAHQQAELEEKLGTALQGLQQQMMVYQYQMQMGFAGAYHYMSQINSQMSQLKEEGRASQQQLARQYEASSRQLSMMEQQAAVDRQKAELAQDQVARLASTAHRKEFMAERKKEFTPERVAEKKLVMNDIVSRGEGKTPAKGPISIAARPDIQKAIADAKVKRAEAQRIKERGEAIGQAFDEFVAGQKTKSALPRLPRMRSGGYFQNTSASHGPLLLGAQYAS